MNKRHQRPEHVLESARKCREAGIRATFNVILGYPGETEADRQQTYRLMGDVASQHDNVTVSANIFTPYPGIPIWPQLIDLGVNEPSRMEDWATLALGANVLPWLQGPVYRDILKSISFFALSNRIRKASWHPSSSLGARLVLRILQKMLHLRMKHHFLKWPLERWIFDTQPRVSQQYPQPHQTAARHLDASS
jgi:radical SAM superfamily enzyme YgiQ (UPF0313 family)